MKSSFLIFLCILSKSLTADVLLPSKLVPPPASSSCEQVRKYFSLSISVMQFETRRRWQYGAGANTRPMFGIDTERGTLTDGLTQSLLPSSDHDEFFLECFSPKYRNPGSHEQHNERLQAVGVCVKAVQCDLKLPEVPDWLNDLIADLDADRRSERQAALKNLLEKCEGLREIDEAQQLSLELLAGQKSRALHDEVWKSLGIANRCVRKKVQAFRKASSAMVP